MYHAIKLALYGSLIDSTAALKTGFHMLRADFSFRASSSGNVDNRKFSKYFTVVKSKNYGWFRACCSLGCASMGTQSLWALRSFVWARRYDLWQNLTARVVQPWAAAPCFIYHTPVSPGRSFALQLQCHRTTSCLVEIAKIAWTWRVLRGANVECEKRAETGLRAHTCRQFSARKSTLGYDLLIPTSGSRYP